MLLSLFPMVLEVHGYTWFLQVRKGGYWGCLLLLLLLFTMMLMMRGKR